MSNYYQENNSANYTVTFAGGSPAKGVLLIMLYIGHTGNSRIDFDRSVYIVQDKLDAMNSRQRLNLSGGLYRALAYDVESDGMLTSSEPAESASVQIVGTSDICELCWHYIICNTSWCECFINAFLLHSC